ncbi:MAG: putative glycoside hydrolase, partial [Methanobacterium sp.]
QINNGNNNPIPLRTYNLPTNPNDNIKSGDIPKTEYLGIANDVKSYMDSTGKTPDYDYQTSLGTYLGFQNLVYMYSKILSSSNGTKLPDSVGMESWRIVSSPTIAMFTISQVKDAAATVKAYVEINNKLPDKLAINGIDVDMSQFLELLTSAALQINKGTNDLIPLKAYSNPTNPVDSIKFGDIPKAEYLGIANDVKGYMDLTGKTPDYDYQTSLGTYLGFQNLVYMYCKILDYHKVNNKLPDSMNMASWRFVSSPTIAMFTIDQIKDAAAIVKSYIDTNSNLPENVTINSIDVDMSQFLELLTSAALQINKGTNDLIPLKEYNDPNCPIDSIRDGNILKAEYLQIANDVKSYMDSTGKTPDYDYQTSLGTYLGFQNLIYMYSKVLDFYKVANYLPNFAEMKTWGIRGYWMWASNSHSFNPWTLKNSGITDIFLLTRSVTGAVYLSELQYVISICKDPGIRVHAWIVCFKDNNVFVNPITAGYKESLLSLIDSIANTPGLNGIHLDYVRYSGVGSNAAKYAPGGTNSAVGVITEFVQSVYNSVKNINPKLKVSAAVMPEGVANRDLYGQDYSRLADYVDFFLPMVYEGNYNANNAWITSATRYIVDRAKGKPVYVGLTTYWSDTNTRVLSSAELDADVISARNGGGSGFVLFRYGVGSYIPC